MSDPIREAFDRLNEMARRDGVGLEMLVSGGEKLALSFQDRKLDTFESSESRAAGLRVVLGAVQGYASTENLSVEALERSYREALANARTLLPTASGPDVPLAKSEPLTDEMADLYRPQDVDMDRKMAIARDLETKALDRDGRIHRVPYSRFSEGSGWMRILNSQGLDRLRRSTAFSGYSYVLAKDGENSKMDGDSFFTRDFSEIDIDDVVGEAVRRATARLGATQLKTGVWPVLVDRDIAAQFLGLVAGSFSAKAVEEKKSLFKDSMNQAVASPVLTLIDDPFERQGTGARPFDDEGCPSRRTTMVENGVLKSFFTNLELSRRMNLPHTASASRGPSTEMGVGSSNLVVARGPDSREVLLKRAPRLLFLTEISGVHSGFKPASGDFSLPGEGFLVEDGQIKGPVDRFVISGNILEFLKKIVAVGDTYGRPGSSLLIPDLFVSELSIAGAP